MGQTDLRDDVREEFGQGLDIGGTIAQQGILLSLGPRPSTQGQLPHLVFLGLPKDVVSKKCEHPQEAMTAGNFKAVADISKLYKEIQEMSGRRPPKG